jgi:hypothetical protein
LKADGRQSPNCIVTLKTASVGLGSNGKVEVTCPLFIPGNPTAKTTYWAQEYAFSISTQSCEVIVQAASQAN